MTAFHLSFASVSAQLVVIIGSLSSAVVHLFACKQNSCDGAWQHSDFCCAMRNNPLSGGGNWHGGFGHLHALQLSG
jgi:hypothetical protein